MWEGVREAAFSSERGAASGGASVLTSAVAVAASGVCVDVAVFKRGGVDLK